MKAHPLCKDRREVWQFFSDGAELTDLEGAYERCRYPMRCLHRPPLLLRKPFGGWGGGEGQPERGPGCRRFDYEGRRLPTKEHLVSSPYSLTNHLTIRAHPPTPLLCLALTQYDTQANASRHKQTLAQKCTDFEALPCHGWRDTSESCKRGPSHQSQWVNAHIANVLSCVLLYWHNSQRRCPKCL